MLFWTGTLQCTQLYDTAVVFINKSGSIIIRTSTAVVFRTYSPSTVPVIDCGLGSRNLAGSKGIEGIEEGSRERASAKYAKNLKLCILTVQLH